MVRVCPQLLSNGACTKANCGYQHDIHLCPVCRVVCTSDGFLKMHMNGRKHKIRVRANACPDPSFCIVCNITLQSPLNYQQHIRGIPHRARLEQQADRGVEAVNAGSTSEVSGVFTGHVKCDVCQIIVPSAMLSAHVTGIQHRKKERFAAIEAAFDEADKDKHGITVWHGEEGSVDFGFIDIDNIRTPPPKTLNVTITLTTPGTISITAARLSSSMAHVRRKSSFLLGKLSGSSILRFQESLQLPVTFSPGLLSGRFHDRLEIVFYDASLQTQFAITRALQAIVGSRADMEILKPSAPYKPKHKNRQVPEGEVISGVKPPALASIDWVVPLPQYLIPKSLEMVLMNPNAKTVVANLEKTWLPRTLVADTYGRYFCILLHAEEATMNTDMQRYDEEDVLMEPLPLGYFRLPVPGLAEKRPSVIVGDRILVQNKGSPPSGRWFEGYVHRIRQYDVDLKFKASFNSYKGQRYNVRFKLGRLPLRRMHQALVTAFNAERVLFPLEKHVVERQMPTETQMQGIRAVNRSIQDNVPQLLAVTAILHMPPGSVPFVVFGPPGTGKTVTVVEAMKQIMFQDPKARILACAPSNSAADLIAERLSDNLSPSQLFRLNAPSRNKDQLPKILERFSHSNNEGTFSIPSLQALRGFRVVVSTCISASVPYGMGMERGHFTHIFIDEAGQACEPEAMIPIKTMADNSTNIVLSGDPKQLGPIIRSTVAMDLGLGMSYLDRLMARDVYDSTQGHGISVVKLIKNWRSHPAILEYPNEQFYKGELEPCGDAVVTHSLLRSDVLVKFGFPIVFHAITGKDMREASSPSFFNPDEASLVKRYVEELRADRRLRLQEGHIGVIAPYHAQVVKIRTLLKKSNSAIKVGSVEEFQGQERRVIIISTVRSTIDFVATDIRQTLGFVANPRRFNVAITRAQALLLVIGDSSVLSLDPLWRGFMNYVYRGGGWKGKEPDWDPNEPLEENGGYDVDRRQTAGTEMDELIARTKELILETSENLGKANAEEAEEARTDLPWREAD